MFEKLKEKRESPYVLKYYSYCLLWFIGISILASVVVLVTNFSGVKIEGVPYIFLFIFFCACVSDLLCDRTMLKYILFDRRNNDLICETGSFIGMKEETIYAGDSIYLNAVYPLPAERFRLYYKSGKKQSFVRFVSMYDKMQLMVHWSEIDSDDQNTPYVFVFYHRSKILKEIRPVEGIDYPDGVIGILNAINKAYP